MLWDPPRELLDFYARNAMLGSSERYRTAAKAWSYMLSQQYGGKKEWNANAPIHERKPKIVIPLYADAVNAMDAFIWGADTFPTATLNATRKKAAQAGRGRDVGPALDPDTANEATSFLQKLVTAGQIEHAMREASVTALVSRTVAMIVYTQGGFLRVHVQDGKDCTPTFSKEHPGQLEKLEIMYRHQAEKPTAWVTVKKEEVWYRRVLTTTEDIVYKAVPVRDNALQPNWEPDPEKSVKHNLGFCPARWLRTFPSALDDVDGQPLIDPSLYPLLDDINYTISQKSRAVHYNTDPQMVRTGVKLGDPSRKDLVKAATEIWDMPEGGDVKFLEIGGAGAKNAQDHQDELRRAFERAARVVITDPEAMRGDISGRVLQFLYRPMIAAAGRLRFDLGTNGYCQVLNLALRLVVTEVERGNAIEIPDVYEMAPRLAEAQREGQWLDFPITLDWPPFLPEPEMAPGELLSVCTGAVASGFVTLKTAAKKLNRFFGVRDNDAEVEAAQQELADRLARATAPPIAP